MAINGTMERIQTVTIGAGGQAAIEFLNIAQTYNDLKIVLSARSTGTESSGYADAIIRFNNTTTNYSERMVYGIGTTDASASQSADGIKWFFGNSNAATAATFGNSEAYIPDYRSSNHKSVSIDTVAENNSASANIVALTAGLWSNSAAITSISITPGSGVWAQHTTATLYGMTRIPAGAKATGGVITDDANFWYHTFTSSDIFAPSQNISCDVLVVAGGGSGGSAAGSGGGAGGLCFQTGRNVTAGSYSITIGGGGARTISDGRDGNAGSNSVFSTITAIGGAGGSHGAPGFSGGSGSGAGYFPGGGGGAATQGNSGGATGYGNAGGANTRSGSGAPYPSAGSGGAGGVGGNAIESAGGVGGIGLGGNVVAALNAFGAATNTGELSGGNYYYAGGGGGSRDTSIAAGGLGGGGRGGTVISGGPSLAPTAGRMNTGGGGGGGIATGTYNAGDNGGVAGGSGIVIIRYAK